uniref:Methyltransferase domain-containing protein n=1 Tax=Candidatus Kentrum sp. LPFa TaxID=2126335 RepID=A0A450XDE6_9GAMM|nr:MAG: Methyltransferase domain-containing protein [Candidatus Kentron sp. LPFa]VFK27307.1 MAG: Methyltransferase domain-containing protein [Candidatus Kentron sp. LPFa]
MKPMSFFFNDKHSVRLDSKDFSLHSGERQVASNLSKIRKDHLLRYRLVSDYLSLYEHKKLSLLDIFCGNGYGTFLLAKNYPTFHVRGIDGSLEAIECAEKNYKLPNNLFKHKLFPFLLPRRVYDVLICFESLEHVENDKLLLTQIRRSLKKNGAAFVSVPNQDEYPLENNPHPFHFRHYSHSDFIDRLQRKFYIEKWYGQNVYEFKSDLNTFHVLPESEMILREQMAGQFNIYLVHPRG